MTDLDIAQDFIGLPSQLPRRVEGLVAFDTETTGLHGDDGARVSVISAAWRQDGQLIHAAFPFGQGGKDGSEVHDLGVAEWRSMIRWLQKAGGGLVAHNAKFDLSVMVYGSKTGLPGVNLLPRFSWDTMVAARELWPLSPGALKPLAQILFGEDADAEQQALKPYLGPKTNPRYDLVPWEIMYPYAAADASLTYRLLERQARLFDEGYQGTRFIGREFETTRALLRMELAGIPYDIAASRKYGDELRAHIADLSGKLPFEPKKAKAFYFGSGERVQETLDLGRGPVETLGLKPYARTEKTNAPQFTAEVMEAMAKDKVPYIAELHELKRCENALSKWYVPFADKTGADGRLRTAFRQIADERGNDGGTKSGRFSVGRVNLQAVPKDYALHLPVPSPRQVIREAVAKLPGWSLFDLDLAQAELRVAAMDAKCQTMLDLIIAGDDAHGTTARELFNTTPEDEGWKVYRQIAKRANFSLIFGSGAVTFRKMVQREAGIDLGDRESKRIVYTWRDLYPEFGRAIDRQMAFVERTGYVEVYGGKRRYYKPGEDWHSGFNQRIQASIAEMAKVWLIGTDRLLRPLRQQGIQDGVGMGGLLLVVHDSQVLLLPDDRSDELTEAARQIGLNAWDQFFPGVPGDIDKTPWE